MTESHIEIVTQILGYLVLLSALISMQTKKMAYLVIWQCLSNVFVVSQFLLRGEYSAMGICTIGAIETLVVFVYNVKNKKFPIFFTVIFTLCSFGVILGLAVKRGYYEPVSDTLPLLAAILFNVAMVMPRSSVARILMTMNSIIWLILNIIKFDRSLVITYSVLITLTVIGIIRLDREDWKAFWRKLFRKEKNKPEIEKST